MHQLTRRQILAGIGAGGLVAAGAGLAGSRSDPPYAKYTLAQSDGGSLRVAWYETYTTDGTTAVQETQGNTDDRQQALDPTAEPVYVDTDGGPVVALPNVLPGDEGTLVVGLEVVDLAEGDDGRDVWFQLRLTGNAENGVNEPESLAAAQDDPEGSASGDDDGSRPLGTGELADAIRVEYGTDGGFFGITGGCDGDPDGDVYDGSLWNAVPTQLGDGEADAGGVPAGTRVSDGRRVADCLAEGDARCFAFRWELPEGIVDQVQGDSVRFDLFFGAQPCGGSNPFAPGGSQ